MPRRKCHRASKRDAEKKPRRVAPSTVALINADLASRCMRIISWNTCVWAYCARNLYINLFSI